MTNCIDYHLKLIEVSNFKPKTMRLHNGILIPSNYFLIFTLFFLALFVKPILTTKRSIYTIHMDSSLMPLAFSSHQTWYSSIVASLMYESPSSLTNFSSKSSLIYSYKNVIHGFSAFLSSKELDALKKFHGFLLAYDDNCETNNFMLHSTYTPEYLNLSHRNGLWPMSNYGKDIIIGVVDSGIYPESPSFRDTGMTKNIQTKWNGSCEEAGEDFNSSLCNNKLIGAKFFNAGLKKVKKPEEITSKESARDTTGHGTFTASIAAGNFVNGVSYFGYAKGTAKGIAPSARIAVYKVVWDSDLTSPDILAGIDEAISDGADVISISLGSPVLLMLHNNSIAIASFAAMEKGILVVCTAGNQGPLSGTISNGFPWVLTVGASTINRWFAGILTLGNGLNIAGWSLFPGNVSSLQNLPLVYDKKLSRCLSTKLFLNSPNGSIVICKAGHLSRQMMVLTEANVSGAILFSDNPTSLELEEFQCPCVVLSIEDEPLLITYAENDENPSASIKFQQTIIGTHPSPKVAKYSSRGPSHSHKHILKPDVIAPGSFILGAMNPKVAISKVGPNGSLLYTDYAIMHGTSMACPHVAGVAALLKAKYPKWSPAAIRSAIITTANPLDNAMKPIRDNAFINSMDATPLDMGAGLIDPNRALDPGLIYDSTPQDYVDLLCSLDFTKEQLSSITRSNTYNCSNQSGDLNYPSFIVFYKPFTFMVQEFRRTVTNVGEGKATYNVSVTAPYNSEVTVSPEKLEFGTKYEKQSYNLRINYTSDSFEYDFPGEIVWVDENEKHKVRSPIVVSQEPF